MFRRARALQHPVTITLDGADVPAERGEPLAVALIIQQLTALGWGTEPRPFPRLLDAIGLTGSNAEIVAALEGMVGQSDLFRQGLAELTAVLDARQYHPVKMAALRRYRSQVDLDSDEFFTWMVSRPEFAIEHYLLVRGRRGPGEGEHGWETDLFAGLEV